MASIPTASEIEMDNVEVEIQEESVDLDSLVKSVKALSPSDWIKLIKSSATEMEKKLKSFTGTKSGRTKKSSSEPKGETPKQLRKTHAWVKFTLQYALKNGWPAFSVENKKTKEIVEMPASVLHDGAHVYEDSITDESPNGKQIIHKDAMSLSKHFKLNQPEVYHEFEQLFEQEQEDQPSESDEKTESQQPVVKKTAAEKAAERKAAADAKAKANADAKAKAAAERKAASEAKKAQTAAAKAQAAADKKAEKEREKADKAKNSPKKAVKSPVKAVAVSSSSSSSSTPLPTVADTPTPAPKKLAAPKKAVKASTAETEPAWECPADDGVYPWTWKTGGNKEYFRNHDNEVWEKDADGGLGKWTGIYDPATNKMDTDAPEPVFEDEE